MRILFLLAGILCGAAATAAETPAPAAASVPAGVAPAAVAAPAVWIFAGLPGDAKRAEKYQGIVTGLRDTLAGRYRIAAADIHVLFGKGVPEAGLAACDRGSLLRELGAAERTAEAGRPVWIFFLGHAKSSGDDAAFHIAGPDVTLKEMAACLKPADGRASNLVILACTSASGKFVRQFARPGRAILAADMPDAADNEPELPAQILAALQSPPEAAVRRGAAILAADMPDAADNEPELPAQILAALQSPPEAAVRRGAVSLADIFTEGRKRLAAWFEENSYEPSEDACLDGNGDGIATRGPYKTDLAGAAERLLPLRADTPGK